MKLPLGYRYSAVYAGIRKVRKDDVALIVPDAPASGAAVFTQNRVQAAPVRIARWNLTKSRGLVSAVLINAGNANCATQTGDRVALACCDAVANHLHVPPVQVFPASTGVIGVELGAHLIVSAVPDLAAGLTPHRNHRTAGASALSAGVARLGSFLKLFPAEEVRNWQSARGKLTLRSRVAMDAPRFSLLVARELHFWPLRLP